MGYIIILLVVIVLLEVGIIKGLGDELFEIKRLLQEILLEIRNNLKRQNE